MDEKTLQALTEMAVKLGTTPENLWGVLINQALITGVSNMILISALVLAACLLVVFVRRNTRGDYPRWEDAAGRITAWCFTGFFCLIVAIVVSQNLNDTVAALVSPEYWALKEILKR